MPVEIIGAPTTRESDGLAMSSRNRYLSAAERAVAPAIYAELERARKAIESGSNDFAALANRGAAALRQAGFRPDYFEIRDAATLEEPGAQSKELVVLTAARIGRARLIDNVRARRAAPRPT
jgi:pantoate--beta-alanine ligase